MSAFGGRCKTVVMRTLPRFVAGATVLYCPWLFQPDKQFTTERDKPHEHLDSSIRFFGHVLDESTPGELLVGVDSPRRHDFEYTLRA
jgi:hypothetical protein